MCDSPEVLKEHDVIGDEIISVDTATSDIDVEAAVLVELLKIYFGSVRCVVNTFSLRITNMLLKETLWQGHMDLVNDISSYFCKKPKASQLFVGMQL